MANPPGEPPLSKSRGLSLFDRQAQLHAADRENSSSQIISDTRKPVSSVKLTHSASAQPIPASLTAQHLQHSPSLVHRRPQLLSTESFSHANDTTVQLIRVHPRPELDYVKEPQPSPTSVPTLQETDFPLYEYPKVKETDINTSENILSSHSTHTNIVEKAPDHSTEYDDDEDVIHGTNEDDSDVFDHEPEDNSVNTNDFYTTTSIDNNKNDSSIQTMSSTLIHDNPDDDRHGEDTIHEHHPRTTSSARSPINEEYDSDFDDSSHGDEEELTHKDSINEYEEQQSQIILRQQQILWGIVQEWSKKEQSYCEQLIKMAEQVYQIQTQGNFQSLVQQLSSQHEQVYKSIQDFHDLDRDLETLIKHLTHTVRTLMETLPTYDEYIRINFTPIRKLFEKKPNTNGLSTEDLLSIPAKQLLQILSQVQDLYQTVGSFELGDKDDLDVLYGCAHRCKVFSGRQDENINKVILKNEDVVIMTTRAHRDRCRLILYPDAIVCCVLKPRLLASPRFTLVWYIQMLELEWKIAENPSNDNLDTGDEVKSSLKSTYKEYEKTSKTNNLLSTRLSKSIRKQENEFNLSQSKLQLVLSSSSSSSRATPPATILFSSAYQLQDWIDLINKTKQELIQRNSATLTNQSNATIRLSESIVQKRLDLIKPNLSESNSNEISSSGQTISPSKTYSGTLCFAIHSIQGPALCNPVKQYQTLPAMSSMQQQLQKNYQFYVAIEIDSFNTFYPYAKTGTEIMQKNGSVEFKGESFQIELEHSFAFRLLIYRIDLSVTDNRNNLQREVCIAKFHRDIETALHDCKRSHSQVIYIESESGDLKLEISLKYSKREGTFKRQPSKRSLAVFGKSIGKLMSVPNGLIDGIPRIVVKCIEAVERDGLTETGIYRVCCVASDLQKLRAEFDRNLRRGEDMLTQKNVHVAANLLKLFFRELPEPLFTTHLYKQFLQAVQLTDSDNQRVTLINTFEQLNPDNRRILLRLFDHLIRVSSHSQINMMHLDNLAVVFGPTLMRPSQLVPTSANSGSNQKLNAAINTNGSTAQTDFDQMSSELQGSMFQCQVVLACLKLRRDGVLE